MGKIALLRTRFTGNRKNNQPALEYSLPGSPAEYAAGNPCSKNPDPQPIEPATGKIPGSKKIRKMFPGYVHASVCPDITGFLPP